MNSPDVTGYLHPQYAASLAEFGKPRFLAHSEGWVIEREIPGTGLRDAIGCYPLFACRNWSRLTEDLNELKSDLLTLTVVTDPFGEYSIEELHSCFPDRVLPFKEHFVVDFEAKPSISKHHRYYTERACSAVQVEVVSDAITVLDDWTALYANLISRFGLTGIRAFSPSAFAQQLTVPGAVVLRAQEGGETVGAHIWYVQGPVAFSHLVATSDRGYDLMASYALYARALEYFAHRVRYLHLGAGAGLGFENDRGNGLTRFKRGWANDTRRAYLGGKIFNQQKYQEIIDAMKIPPGKYFPAYRINEFS